MHNTAEIAKEIARWKGDDVAYGVASADQRLGPVDSRRTALIVVDMQKLFSQDGMPLYVPGTAGLLPRINLLAEAVRGAGGQVVWLRQTWAAGAGFPNWMWSAFATAMHRLKLHTASGSVGHALNDAAAVQSEDWIIDKTLPSAFVQGSSDLHERLQAQGIDRLLITGCVSNGCCESTARDAMQMGYKVHFVYDATGTFSDDEQRHCIASLKRMHFFDICSVEECLEMLPSA